MALCKGTNFCIACGKKLTEEEKETLKQPVCNECMAKKYPAQLSGTTFIGEVTDEGVTLTPYMTEPGFSAEGRLEEISLIPVKGTDET